MKDVYVIDAVRTPIGKYGGALSSVRPDDLLALVIRELLQRNKAVDVSCIEDVIAGDANQAGEDNRNVARMATLLAGLPVDVPGSTINRLCGSGLDAVGTAARAIRTGEAELMLAGGVESMTRAPFVQGKATEAFARAAEIYDTTIGWRFVNGLMKTMYGTDSMPETGENVAEQFQVTRQAQDEFALRSQQKARAAQESGFFAREIAPVTIKGRRGDTVVDTDEHPRGDTTMEMLQKLRTPFRNPGTVTAGNASGVNDGAAALLLASEAGANRHGLTPRARVVAMATAGVELRIMGIGPAPAVQKLLARTGITLKDVDVIELNEAFASQVLACLKELPIDPDRLNVNGGAIALGHPLGCTGAKLTTTLLYEMKRRNARYGMVTMCVGGGMGAAGIFERV